MGRRAHRASHLRESRIAALLVAVALMGAACAGASSGDRRIAAGNALDISAADAKAVPEANALGNPFAVEMVEGGRGQQAVHQALAQASAQTDDPPEELAFATGVRFGLGPNVTIAPPVAKPSTAFSAGLLAGNQAARIARSADVSGAQVDYWGDFHAVVMTVNHALVTAPNPEWLAPVLGQVTTIARQVWGPESGARLETVGLDWTAAAPALVILDEANNAELLCSSATMIAFGSGEIAVTPEGLAEACQ